MPKDLEGDASCRVPGPTEMTKTLDEDLDLISQVFDGKLVKLCQIRSHTKIWESRKRIWWQQLQGPREALLTAQRQGVALEVAHHDLHQLHKHNDLRQGLDRGPRRSQGSWFTATVQPFSCSAILQAPSFLANSCRSSGHHSSRIWQPLAAQGSEGHAVPMEYLG